MKFTPFLLFYRKPVFLLIIYVFLSILLMTFNDPASLGGIRNITLQTVEFFANIRYDLLMWKDYQKEAQELKNENARLKIANQNYREVALENIRLKKLLNLPEKEKYDFIGGKVIGSGVELGVRSLVLNVGEKDSVRENMPVINGDGLIGKIISVSPDQSITQILMDHNSLVSARLEGSRESGVISWDGKSWLNLLYISRDVPVSAGGLVVTSGLSKIYPGDLRIGVVSDIKKNDYDLFSQIKVSPSVNFNTIEEVLIIKSAQPGLLESMSHE